MAAYVLELPTVSTGGGACGAGTGGAATAVVMALLSFLRAR
jgi:shikimate 5-dehydrogenase